jgi:hypothetical protein
MWEPGRSDQDENRDVMQRVVPRKKSNERDVNCRLQCRWRKTSEERAGRVRSASCWWVFTGARAEEVAVVA